mgnify:CR=1 FL=1
MKKSELSELLHNLDIPVNEGISSGENMNKYPRIIYWPYIEQEKNTATGSLIRCPCLHGRHSMRNTGNSEKHSEKEKSTLYSDMNMSKTILSLQKPGTRTLKSK